MCKCRPEIRTPFCGRPGCGWQHFDAPTPADVKAFNEGDEVMQSLKPQPNFDYGKFMVRVKMLTTVLHQLYAKSEYKWIAEYASEAEARIEQLEQELSRERSYSRHYEQKFHAVAAECADLASNGVGTVGDLIRLNEYIKGVSR